MLRLINILIIGLCVIISVTNAQYAERWGSSPTNGSGNYYIGCENTDADAAKEVVFLKSIGDFQWVISIVDGVSGVEEWTLSPSWWMISSAPYEIQSGNYPRLIDVDNDERYEILFCGSQTSSDSFSWHLYGYNGVGIKQEREPQSNLYQEISLGQSRPNPLTSITTIDYSLTQKAKVVMKIYNSTGQLVRTLFEGDKNPGNHSINWDSRDNNGVKVANGSYYYQLEINDQKQIKRMVLIK